MRVLPDGTVRAGCGRGLFGGRGHGALVLFAERVRCSGRGVRADGRLHAGADSMSGHVLVLRVSSRAVMNNYFGKRVIAQLF